MDHPDHIHGRVAFARTCGAVRVTESRYTGHTQLPPHAHPAAYLSFVIAGSYVECVGRHQLTCGPNVLRYHPLGEVHRDMFGPRGGACLNVELSPELSEHVGRVPSRPLTVDSVAWQALRLRREAARGDDTSQLVVQEIAIQLLDACHERARVIRTVNAAAPLRRAIDFVDAHLADRFTLGAVAEAAEVHETHLARLFKQRLGMTAGDYVRRRRVVRAEYQLRAMPSASASSIAASLGFADLAHFSRTFRRVLGVTPSEYRRICSN
jgi:AraC family transcriptional regulator